MTEAPSSEPKQRLLADAVEFLAANGIGDISLRRLAAALGTSHRMLIYHFGSKDRLLVEVARAVEQRQRALLAELQLDPATTAEEIARRFWGHLADPAMWPFERLFFELYGRALQGDPDTAALLDGVVEQWLEPATEWHVRRGVPAETARAQARLGVAVTRGLLLDLLATGDRDGVQDAMEHFLAMIGAAGYSSGGSHRSAR